LSIFAKKRAALTVVFSIIIYKMQLFDFFSFKAKIWGIIKLANLLFFSASLLCFACNPKTDLRPPGKKKIPTAAYQIRDFVRINGQAKNGYIGGRTFKNLEKLLPNVDANGKKIKYKEWDIYKKIKGKNRGPHRLVTGSDGSDYYTGNHYKSFDKMTKN
jgi:ribonuclease T1